MSKYSFSTAKRLVKDFKNYIDRTESAYNEFLLSLEEESRYYAQIISPKQDQWKQPEHICVYSILLSLNVFGTSQVRSFLLSLFKTRNEGLVSHKLFIKVLNFLEYFHFVFTAVCSSRASGLERRYSSYARRLRKCHTKQEVAKTVEELISILKESIPPYTVFEHNFLKIQFTSEKTQRRSLVQFILKKCEQFYAETDELAPLSFTIEHIIPESTKADYVGLIGNLLPLGEELNSKLSNKDFAHKLQGYAKSNYFSVQEFIKTHTGTDTFDKNKIELRSKKLCSLLYYDVWKI